MLQHQQGLYKSLPLIFLFTPLLLKAIIQKLGMLSVVTIQGMALFT